MENLIIKQQNQLHQIVRLGLPFILPVINSIQCAATIVAARRLHATIILVPNGTQRLIDLAISQAGVHCLVSQENDYKSLSLIGNTNMELPNWMHNVGTGGGCVMFTSGSSSTPKLVYYDWDSCENQARTTIDRFYNSIDASRLQVITASNIGHAYNSNGFLSAIMAGFPLHTPKNAAELCQVLSENSKDTTILFGTPGTYGAALELLASTTINRRNLIAYSAGCPISEPLQQAICKVFEVPRVKQNYGSSETGIIAVENIHDNSLVPWSEIVFQPPVSGTLLPRGADGEISIQNSNWISKGYISNSELKPHKSLYRTSDAGALHAGSLSVMQRLHPPLVILRDGLRIQLQGYEVESKFREANPHVIDVAAVQGANDTLDMYVVIAPGASTTFHSKSIFTPDRVKIVEHLPVSPAGKILYSELPACT